MVASPSPRLLLVDSDVSSAQVLARMLREDGFDVEVAFDGATAISMLSRSRVPAALITVVNMPKVDGYAVARYARSVEPQMPVIFVSPDPNLSHAKVRQLSPPPLLHLKPIDYERLSAQLGRVTQPGFG